MDRMDSPTPSTDAKTEEAGKLTDILIPKPKVSRPITRCCFEIPPSWKKIKHHRVFLAVSTQSFIVIWINKSLV